MGSYMLCINVCVCVCVCVSGGVVEYQIASSRFLFLFCKCSGPETHTRLMLHAISEGSVQLLFQFNSIR